MLHVGLKRLYYFVHHIRHRVVTDISLHCGQWQLVLVLQQIFPDLRAQVALGIFMSVLTEAVGKQWRQ